MRIITITSIIYLISFPLLAVDGYLCVGSKMVGFNVERKFNITKFPTHEWIIKKTNENTWNVYKQGKKHPELYCDDTNPNVFEKLKCNGLYGSLLMSRTTLRFVSSTYGQYIDDDRNTENIAIEFGKCSKL